jgi:hypothetical protein
MSNMLKKVAGGVWKSVIEFIRRELITNPRYRTDPVWYFVIPECRALIPADALEVPDCCGAGIPLPNARREGHLPNSKTRKPTQTLKLHRRKRLYDTRKH